MDNIANANIMVTHLVFCIIT